MSRHDYDKAMFRLSTIIARLNLGERLHPQDLAEEFNVTVRTIQKDLNQRLALAFPIERTQEGAYVFMEGFRLKGSSDREHALTVALADCFMAQVHPKVHEAYRSALGLKDDDQGPFVLALGMESLDGNLDTFNLLRQSIDFRQSLIFTYTTKEGHTREYHADPYRLANFQGFWYLVAFDRNDDKLKTFYLRALSRIRVSPESYTIDDAIEQEIQETYGCLTSAWFKAECKSVTLQAFGEAKRYLSRNAPANCEVLEEDDNTLQLRMIYHMDVEVLCLVKHWLPDIIIKDDERLQRSLHGQLAGYLERCAMFQKAVGPRDKEQEMVESGG